MQKVLNKLQENYNLLNEDSAFDIFSGIMIFKKSAECVFSENWLKIKTLNGKYCNDSSDGKIDLIDFDINHNERIIKISFLQVQNSETMSSDKIQLFVHSIEKYFIKKVEIKNDNYKSLVYYQKKLLDLLCNNCDYKVNYYIYIAYSGHMNRTCDDVLKDSVKALKLSNVFCRTFCIEDLNKELNEVKRIIKHPKNVSYNVTSNENIIINDNAKFNSVIMKLNALEIKQLIDYEQKQNIELNRLFNNNVRGFLESSDINYQIRKTIECYPDSFYFCNNGATIFCDEIKIQSHNSIHIENPRILNGQQSIASIYLYDKRKKTDICVKFISSKSSLNKNMEMNLICKTTNTSNKVMPINLISNSKLMFKVKEKFEEENINVNLKEGKLLNSIFSNEQSVDLEDLLKMWATIFLERPDYAKSKKKIVNIFYKSELEEKNYIVFQNDEIIEKVVNEFWLAYLFFNNIKNQLKILENKEYYSHGFFAINFMIYKQYVNPNQVEESISNIKEKIDIKDIEAKIENLILNYKKECEKNGISYSLNNYFKGTRVIKDLGYDVQSDLEYIKKLEEFKNIKTKNISKQNKELLPC